MGIPTDVINARRSLVTRILVKRFLYRHPKAWGGAYLAAGCVHVFLGLIMSAYGYRWAPALIAAGALELRVAYELISALADSREQ
jgi:hypothetical protein